MNGASLSQLKQSLLVPPEHVPQEALHGTQALLVSANLPRGVQSSTQVLGASKKGYTAVQVVHSSTSGPVHVAHDS